MSDGKLGKRYVHVIDGEPGPIMTERPGDIADSRRQATIEIDLDAGRPIDRPEYEHAERTWINAYAECQRLRPDKRPDDVLAAELVRLRGQVAAMSKVVDAADAWADRQDPDGTAEQSTCVLWRASRAYRSGQSTTTAAVEPVAATTVVELRDGDIEWHTWPPNRYGGQQVGVSTGVIAVHRPTGIAAVCVDERSMQSNRRRASDRLRVLIAALDRGDRRPTSPATLTPAQWAALFELADWMRARSRNKHNVIPPNWADACSAIDRLRETAYANRNGLDDGDVRRLREAAREWLSTPWPPGSVERHPIERNLTNTLRSLLDSGKLGGGP